MPPQPSTLSKAMTVVHQLAVVGLIGGTGFGVSTIVGQIRFLQGQARSYEVQHGLDPSEKERLKTSDNPFKVNFAGIYVS
jgi:hypothetical protein